MASVILAGLVINNAIRRNNVRSRKIRDEFWERERSSYKAPSRPTDDLESVTFPEDLPLDIDTGDPVLSESQGILKNLSRERIINLSNITNTDIRLSYGKDNLPELSRADARYITLLRALNTLASGYIRLGYKEEGKKLLTFALDAGSDLKESWLALGQLYLDEDDIPSLISLKKKAEGIEGVSGKDIRKGLDALMELKNIVS